jgi:hypothetical protein
VAQTGVLCVPFRLMTGTLLIVAAEIDHIEVGHGLQAMPPATADDPVSPGARLRVGARPASARGRAQGAKQRLSYHAEPDPFLL